MLTSDPTSDSSDTGGSGKSNDETKHEQNEWTNDKQTTDAAQMFVHPANVVKPLTTSRKTNKETSKGPKETVKNVRN